METVATARLSKVSHGDRGYSKIIDSSPWRLWLQQDYQRYPMETVATARLSVKGLPWRLWQQQDCQMYPAETLATARLSKYPMELVAAARLSKVSHVDCGCSTIIKGIPWRPWLQQDYLSKVSHGDLGYSKIIKCILWRPPRSPWDTFDNLAVATVCMGYL